MKIQILYLFMPQVFECIVYAYRYAQTYACRLSDFAKSDFKTMRKVRWHRSGTMGSGVRRRPTVTAHVITNNIEIAGIPLARATSQQNNQSKSIDRHHCTYQYLTTTLHFCDTTMRGTITPGLKAFALKDSAPQSIRSEKSGTASRFPIFGSGTIDRL
jgi:hypothetical protein